MVVGRVVKGPAMRVCPPVFATVLIQWQLEDMGEASQIHFSIGGAVSETVANKELHCLDTCSPAFGNKTEAKFTVHAA